MHLGMFDLASLMLLGNRSLVSGLILSNAERQCVVNVKDNSESR